MIIIQLYDDLKTEIDANHSLNPIVVDGEVVHYQPGTYLCVIYEGDPTGPKAGIGKGTSIAHMRSWPFVIECIAETEAKVKALIIETARCIEAKAVTSGEWVVMAWPTKVKRVGYYSMALGCLETKVISIGSAF